MKSISIRKSAIPPNFLRTCCSPASAFCCACFFPSYPITQTCSPLPCVSAIFRFFCADSSAAGPTAWQWGFSLPCFGDCSFPSPWFPTVFPLPQSWPPMAPWQAPCTIFCPKRLDSLDTALVISMITGRVLWGVTRLIFSLFGAPALTLGSLLELCGYLGDSGNLPFPPRRSSPYWLCSKSIS